MWPCRSSASCRGRADQATRGAPGRSRGSRRAGSPRRPPRAGLELAARPHQGLPDALVRAAGAGGAAGSRPGRRSASARRRAGRTLLSLTTSTSPGSNSSAAWWNAVPHGRGASPRGITRSRLRRGARPVAGDRPPEVVLGSRRRGSRGDSSLLEERALFPFLPASFERVAQAPEVPGRRHPSLGACA